MIIPEDRMTMEEAVKHPFVTKRGELPPVDIAITGSVDQAQWRVCWNTVGRVH